MKIRVYYEDTDAGGIVYHTNYIKFCERARSEAFFEHGMKPMEEINSGFVVRNIQADFLATAKLGELLEVKTTLLRLKNSSTLLQQEVFRDETKLFHMEILLVYIREGRPAKMPENFRALLEWYR